MKYARSCRCAFPNASSIVQFNGNAMKNLLHIFNAIHALINSRIFKPEETMQ
ncbi:hypothetical protein HNQ59_001508 [Chitinivorax tropicus]|uniref:Uncharacterized protein n=1 Tax=Chitinivorax tropicus TaxID=714531 RepID=A0A840MPW5_9PROT|nr:hypothetical protein [Chitinivorax tropicus]